MIAGAVATFALIVFNHRKNIQEYRRKRHPSSPESGGIFFAAAERKACRLKNGFLQNHVNGRMSFELPVQSEPVRFALHRQFNVEADVFSCFCCDATGTPDRDGRG